MATASATEDFSQLCIASKYSEVDKISIILERGKCNVNCIGYDGWAPLHWACIKGHVDVVRVLVSKFKADVTIQSPYGNTPLMLARAVASTPASPVLAGPLFS